MLRKESISGQIDDLGHVRTADMLADCLTKNSAKPDALLQAVDTGVLPNVDASPSFRSLIKHKAYAVSFLSQVIDPKRHVLSDVTQFLGTDIADHIHCYLASPQVFQSMLGETVGPPATDKSTSFRWHAHACAQCERRFAHYHDCDALHTHDANAHPVHDHVCCYADCPAYFVNCQVCEHNPFHSRPSS